MEKNKMIDFSVDHLIENTRKKTANPGGGAITSLVGNLGLNLILMMAKKDYKDEKLNKKSKKIEDKFKKYSEELKELMQEDIDKVNLLIKAYKNKEIKNYDDYIIEANKAPKRTIELMIIVLQDCDFILKYLFYDSLQRLQFRTFLDIFYFFAYNKIHWGTHEKTKTN